jgi:DNA-binding PadR family transcriptional regulator
MNKTFSMITIYILLSLINNDLTGYELMKEVKKQSEGDLTLYTGTLYPKLKKLETENLVEVSGIKVTGSQNIRYKITNDGIEYLNNNMNNLEELVLKIRSRLEEDNEKV